jgi:hypothetical protein
VPGAQRLLSPLSWSLGSSSGCVSSIDGCGNPERTNDNECFDDESCLKASSTKRGLSRDAISTIRTQIAGEGAGDSDGLYRGTLDFSAQVAASLGFETRASFWYEPLLGPDDKLLFLDSNLLLEIPATPSVQFYLGGGARSLLDVSKNSELQGGGQGLLRVDIYPKRPLVLRVAGMIGGIHSVITAEGRGTIGIQREKLEFYAGYSSWVIGRTTLHGPVAGIRLTL